MQLDEMEEELDDEHVSLANDVRLALVDGELAGYAYTFHLPSELREERCYVFGEVDPAFRRRGVGTSLMRWGIERAEQQLRSSGRSLPRYIRADSYDFIDGAHRLFAHVGMRVVRYTDELLRPLTDLPPLTQPNGARVIPWPEGRDEEIRVAKNEAFADHWGSTPTAASHWEQMVHGYGSRPDLSFIAVDADDRVIGHCLDKRFPSDDELLGRRAAWIDNLGTLREWRGKGVASALIAHALHAFAAADCTHASIAVDSENPTGAAQLYRRLGFLPEHRTITHEIELA
jgi:ribosomal protein S18 acetylase RimI-like enzyme